MRAQIEKKDLSIIKMLSNPKDEIINSSFVVKYGEKYYIFCHIECRWKESIEECLYAPEVIE